MKVLKYIVSVFVLAAVTLAAFYFPSLYSQKYEYETVIEELEQYSYEKPDSKANLWQISTIMKDIASYQYTTIYRHKTEKTEADREIENGYLKIIQNIFQNYITSVEKGIEEETDKMGNHPVKSEWHDMFQNWIINWIKEKEDWQIEEVHLYNLMDVFSGEFIHIQLYNIYLTMPKLNNKLEICFSPDTQIFYTILIYDDRYIFEKNINEIPSESESDPSMLYPFELYIYYKKQEESEHLLEAYWTEMIHVYTSEHTLFSNISQ